MSVSIIIPIKNRAHLLPATLYSILKQTRLPNEIIIVDDGSTDNLNQIIEFYKDQVVLIPNHGTGPGAARNTGLRLAKGKYIQFFDSDDLMTNNKLKVQADLLKENDGIDIVYGPYVRASEEDGGWQQLDAVIQYYPLPNKPLSQLVVEGWCSLTQSCLFKKSLIDRAGYWREDLMPHEDKEYWYRLAYHSNGHLHENKSCVIYRQHQKQITDNQTLAIERALDGLKAYTIIKEHVEQEKINLKSRIILQGIITAYKKYLIENNYSYQLETKDIMALFFYRVTNKLERLITGIPWSSVLGANKDRTVFDKYMENI